MERLLKQGVVRHLVKRCAKLRENEDGEEGSVRHLVKRCAKLRENKDGEEGSVRHLVKRCAKLRDLCQIEGKFRVRQR